MLSIQYLLMLLALVSLLCAALGVSSKRVSLGWLGLFLWLLSSVVR